MKNHTIGLMSLSFGLGIMLSGCFHEVADGVQVAPQPVKVVDTLEVIDVDPLKVKCHNLALEQGIVEGGDFRRGSAVSRDADGTLIIERFMDEGFLNGHKFTNVKCEVLGDEVVNLTFLP